MENTTSDVLDRKLLDAHKTHDNRALVSLYTRAADDCEKRGNINAACFYLTHAYVFALQHGMMEAVRLRTRLVDHGREE